MELSKKGQGTVEIIIAVPIVVIALLVAFVILSPISQTLFDELDSMNSSVISNISTIRVIIGLIPLILAAVVIMRVVASFRQPSQRPPGYV